MHWERSVQFGYNAVIFKLEKFAGIPTNKDQNISVIRFDVIFAQPQDTLEIQTILKHKLLLSKYVVTQIFRT